VTNAKRVVGGRGIPLNVQELGRFERVVLDDCGGAGLFVAPNKKRGRARRALGGGAASVRVSPDEAALCQVQRRFSKSLFRVKKKGKERKKEKKKKKTKKKKEIIFTATLVNVVMLRPFGGQWRRICVEESPSGPWSSGFRFGLLPAFFRDRETRLARSSRLPRCRVRLAGEPPFEALRPFFSVAPRKISVDRDRFWADRRVFFVRGERRRLAGLAVGGRLSFVRSNSALSFVGFEDFGARASSRRKLRATPEVALNGCGRHSRGKPP